MIKDGTAANAKSILGVMILAAEFGAKLTVRASGSDEQEAVERLCKLIQSKFDGSEIE